MDGPSPGKRPAVDTSLKVLPALAWESLTRPLCTRQASYNGCENIVMELVKSGARLDIAARGSETPLLLALEKRHYKIIGLLLACGAKVHKLGETPRTSPVLMALERGEEEVLVAMLSSLVADTEVFDDVVLDAVESDMFARLQEAVRAHPDQRVNGLEARLLQGFGLLGPPTAVEWLLQRVDHVNNSPQTAEEAPQEEYYNRWLGPPPGLPQPSSSLLEILRK